jgi:NADH dehydrogenase FAD-containing subunit
MFLARVNSITSRTVTSGDTVIGRVRALLAAAGEDRPLVARRVDACLRSVSHPEVFAAGDIAHVDPYPRPKAGVYAVRQGPRLATNLHHALLGRRLEAFRPQRDALSIISTGGAHAIASRGPFAVAGAWVWRWVWRQAWPGCRC